MSLNKPQCAANKASKSVFWVVYVRNLEYEEEEAPMHRVAQPEGRFSIAGHHNTLCPIAASLISAIRKIHIQDSFRITMHQISQDQSVFFRRGRLYVVVERCPSKLG